MGVFLEDGCLFAFESWDATIGILCPFGQRVSHAEDFVVGPSLPPIQDPFGVLRPLQIRSDTLCNLDLGCCALLRVAQRETCSSSDLGQMRQFLERAFLPWL